MNTKYNVEVRNGDDSVVETIKVTLRAESIGNFNPLFCTYKSDKRCLVQSDALHLDEPMRCHEADHVGKLYIKPRGKDGKIVAIWAENNR